MKLKSLALLALLAIAVASCRKKSDPVIATPNTDTTKTGGDTTVTPVDTVTQLKMSFRNVVNGDQLVLLTVPYVNERGDSFFVNRYKYYISNISLYTANGTEYKEPESYHMIDQYVDSSLSFIIKGLPTGSYTRIRFMIGVDSARNTSGAQTGALDLVHGMFWDWKSGYIMAMMDGVTPGGLGLSYHIAGFKGTNSALRWVELTLPADAIVSKSGKPHIHLRSDVAEWFKTPYTIAFALMPSIGTVGTNSSQMASNYADMFTIEKVE